MAKTVARTVAKTVTKASQKSQKSRKASAKKTLATVDQGTTVGEYAYAIIAKQYHRLVKQEAGVLQDKDPECLHQMRVGTRRLRTALQVFGAAIKLPKSAREKHVRKLTQVLGQLRDLDVQIAALTEQYRPQLPSSEQKLLDRAIKLLHKQRNHVFAKVEAALTGTQYCHLKQGYEAWLDKPEYTLLAQLPIEAVLPDLLSPLLSKLLLHPGWLIAAADHSSSSGVLLHELRKTCKQARYQAEFFAELYEVAFQNWVDELKQLQENLGIVQDTHVLLEILQEKVARMAELPKLHRTMQQQQENAMTDWDTLRTKYTDAKFRYSLYQMLLSSNPTGLKH